MICPCCGGPMTAEAGAYDRLSRQQREIVELVSRNPGRVIPIGDIISHLYQLKEEPDNAATAVHVQVYRINRKMGRKVVEGILGRDGGYRLASPRP